jgi:Leucine-rich repeat (LRR) protein
LWLTQVDDAGLAHLGNAKGLKRLVLRTTSITDAGLEHLKDLQSLEWLDISENEVTDAGLKHLAGLKSLKDLIINNCPSVTEEAIESLEKAIPGLRIEW